MPCVNCQISTQLTCSSCLLISLNGLLCCFSWHHKIKLDNGLYYLCQCFSKWVPGPPGVRNALPGVCEEFATNYVKKDMYLYLYIYIFFFVCYIDVFCTDGCHCPSLLFAVVNYQMSQIDLKCVPTFSFTQFMKIYL